MAICSVFNCKSNNDKRLKRNNEESVRTEIKFFRFPKDKALLKIWIHKCRRNDKFNIANSYICSKHFTADDYKRNFQHELLKYSPKNSKKLKDSAIPSLNLPNNSSEINGATSRNERQKIRNRKQLVDEILDLQNIESTSEEYIEIFDFEPSNANDNTDPLATKKYADAATSTECLSKYRTETMESEIVQLKANVEDLQKECYQLRKDNECIKKIFTDGQLTQSKKHSQQMLWTNGRADEKALGKISAPIYMEEYVDPESFEMETEYYDE